MMSLLVPSASNNAESVGSLDRRAISFPGLASHVTLWSADLNRVSDDLCLEEAWLSRAELARADLYGTEALRASYVAGRSFVRWLLGAELAIAPGAVAIGEERRGRPRLQGECSLDFNVSHTGSRVIVGLLRNAEDRFCIGVDIERSDRNADVDRISRRILSKDELGSLIGLTIEERRARLLRYWTCKEALSKATGDGLVAPFAQLVIDIDRSPRLVSGPSPYLPGGWQLRTLAIAGGEYVVAVALWNRTVSETVDHG